MLLATTHRLHHRDPSQRIRSDVEHEAVPVGRDDGVGPAGEARAPEIRPGRLGRFDHRLVAHRPRRPAARPCPTRTSFSYSDRPGRTSWYWTASSSSFGSSQLEAVAVDVRPQQVPLRDPVELAVELDGSRSSAASTAPNDRAPGRRSRRRRTPRVRSRRRTSARAAGTPTAIRSRCSDRGRRRRPSRAASGRATPCASREPAIAIDRSLSMKPSSIIASTIAVVPTFRNVATSHRFASPTITCSRRYFCGSACGSSRVLTIGRFKRRLEPDLFLEEVGALADLVVDRVGAVLGADLARAGEHLPRHEPRNEVAHQHRERHVAVDEVVLVTAVRVALAVAVVLVDDDLLARGQQPAGRVHRAGEDALPRLVEQHHLHRVAALGRRVLGVRVVDVVAGAVGEHRVDEMGLDLGRLRPVAGEAARVAAGRLVLEVPTDAALLDVAVDQAGSTRRPDSGRARRAVRRRTRSRCRRSSGRPRLSVY